VLPDACGHGDAEVHRVLMDKVLARQAAVTSTSDWVATLG
jgi:hypothetical protein